MNLRSDSIALLFEKILNIILAVFGIFFVILLIYFSYNFTSISKVTQVYGGVGFLIVVIIYLITLKSSITWKTNFVFSGVIFLFCIYTLEFILPPKKYEIIQNLKAKGQNAETAVTFPTHKISLEKNQLMPIAGISRTTTVLCKEDEYWSVYESDEHGFNNPLGLYSSSPSIALIGDSYTHGYCVHPDETIAAFLRRNFPLTLSFGIGGAGPLLRFAQFKEYVEKLKPKIVIWLETKNTIHRIVFEDRLRRYLEEKNFSQDLMSKQKQIDAELKRFLKDSPENFLDFKPNWLKRLLLVRVRDLVMKKFFGNQFMYEPSLDLDENTIKTYKKILNYVKNQTESWGGKFLYLYLSDRPEEKPTDHDLLLGITKELKIASIDLEPIIKNYKGSKSIFPNGSTQGHFSAVGYELVANAILSEISNTK